MDVKESDILGSDIGIHWYYRAKSAAVRCLLSGQHFSHVLDIGAGSGFFSRELLRHRLADASICVDPNYDRESDELENGRPILFRRSGSGKKGSDLLLMMDVLEHVDDECALLRASLKQAAPGCLVLISVPAFNSMWSGHDDFLGHRRRYTLRGMELLLRSEGLESVSGCYFYGLLLPAVYLMRKLSRSGSAVVPKSDLRRHGQLVNFMLMLICFMELPFMRVNRIAGLTVFCLARVSASAKAIQAEV